MNECDICHLPTLNLGAHRAVCEKKRAVARPLQMRGIWETDLIVRAGAHARPGLTEENGVTDLNIARLVHWIERGGLVHPSLSWRTYEAPGMPRMTPRVSRVAMEALRLGIVRPIMVRTGPYTFRTQLAAAPVHAMSATDRSLPACGAEDKDVLRWRLLTREDVAQVDCRDCTELPLSCVATSL